MRSGNCRCSAFASLAAPRIIKALETSGSMVYPVRKQLAEEGFEAGVEPQATVDAIRATDL